MIHLIHIAIDLALAGVIAYMIVKEKQRKKRRAEMCAKIMNRVNRIEYKIKKRR